MSHLTLCLLGPIQASLDGRPITSFRSNKVRALLAYLALESDRRHARDSLAGLLWPGYTDRSALNSLRSSLANLRRALGDQEADPPILLITRESVQFTTESRHTLDVATLMAAIPAAGNSPEPTDRLTQAAALYRGELLEGFSLGDCAAFEEWVSLRREQVHRHILAVEHCLAAHHQARANYAQAEHHARRCLVLDAWDEKAHRQLMQALALSGQRAAALSQYGACQRLLAESLDVEPAEETTALYERIRDGALESGVTPRPHAPLRLVPDLARLPERVTAEKAQFVGREAELSHLQGALDVALDGHGRVVFVVGEAGSGKTALVQAFARRAMAQREGLAAAMGCCNAMTGIGDPYLPFIEIMGMLTGAIEAQWLGGSLDEDHARRLLSLMPLAVETLLREGGVLLDRLVSSGPLLDRLEAYGGGDDGPLGRLHTYLQRRASSGGASIGQPQLLEQTTRVLQAISHQRPLLLVLDDLHWADAGSLALLFHLGRRLEGFPLLVIGTYRAEDVALGRDGQRHPLESVVDELQRLHGDRPVDLDQSNGWAFLQALLDSEPNHLGIAFREKLYAHVGGHPLYMLELLRGMQERGDLLRDGEGACIEGPGLDWGTLPARVEAVLDERLGRLPSELQVTLAVASVEGDTFSAQAVARVRGTDEGAIIGQLSGPLSKEHHLVLAQSVSRVGGQPLYRYRFHHHLIQAYLYDHLDAVERAYFHGQVGDAMHDIHGDRPGAMLSIAPQLGWHYREAGRVADASEYLYQAGVEAARLAAPQEALSYFEQALRLAGCEALRDRILGVRGRLLLDLFLGQEAAEDYERLLEHGRHADDRRAEMQAMLGLARANYIVALDAQDGSYAVKSRDLYQAAYDLARDLGDRAAMARALIGTKWFVGRWPEYRERVVANVREGYALSQELGDRDLIGDSTMALVAAVREHGSLIEAEGLAEELLPRLLEDGDLFTAKELLFELMGNYLGRGSFEKSLASCDQGMELAAQLGVPPVLYPTLKAWALLELGRYGAAREALQAEVADEEHPFGRAWQAHGMGLYYLAVGACDKAAARFRQVWKKFDRMGRRGLVAWTQRELVRSLARARLPDAAALRGAASDLVAMQSAAGLTDHVSRVALAEAALSLRNLDEALDEARKTVISAQARGTRLDEVAAIEVELRALLALGRPSEGVDLADEAIPRAMGMGWRPMEWRLRAGRALALEMLGQDASAGEEYRGAAELIRELAEAIPDVALRARFLSHPSVSTVLAASN